MARVQETLPTGHQMKKIKLYLDKHHAVTYGYDGLVIVRNPKMTTILGTIMPHHRLDGGILQAFIDPSGRYVVSLGRDLLLLCSRIKNVEGDNELEKQLREQLESGRMKLMFARKTIGFMPKGNDGFLSKPHLELYKTFRYAMPDCQHKVFDHRSTEMHRSGQIRGVATLLPSNCFWGWFHDTKSS